MHEANKPQLGDALWKTIGENDPKVSDDTLYSLDSGSLLHKIPWKKWQTFDSICQSYVNHVLRYYGPRATVVFDGYHGPSTKDTTHIHRTKGRKSGLVKLSLNNKLTAKKKIFMLNQQNKQRFIELLSQQLQKANISVKHSDDDADLLIVQTALEVAEQ